MIFQEFNYQLNFTDVSDQCSCPTNGDATFSINIIDISLNGSNCKLFHKVYHQ